MGKSIELKNDNFWDTTGIVHNRQKLSDLLNNIFEWKKVGNATGNSIINIDVDYNELLIVCKQDRNLFVSIIPKFLLTNVKQYFNLGGRFTISNTGYGISGILTLTTFQLEYLYSNTVDKTSQATTTIYYR